MSESEPTLNLDDFWPPKKPKRPQATGRVRLPATLRGSHKPCEHCHVEYYARRSESRTQWENRSFCSGRCKRAAQKLRGATIGGDDAEGSLQTGQHAVSRTIPQPVPRPVPALTVPRLPRGPKPETSA